MTAGRRGLLLSLACLPLLSCSSQSSTRADAVRDGKQAQKAPAASGTVTQGELESGQRSIARLLTAMGGTTAIGGITTLSLAGTMTRPLPGGKHTVATVRTFVKFPNLYRQELRLPAGKITTLIGPSGGWIISPKEAPLPLPEERRLEIENIILRNPVALLKTKDSELFSAVGAGGPGAGTDLSAEVLVRVGSKETKIALDARGLIQTMSFEMPGSGPGPRPRLVVEYSDYRNVGPVLYPFSSRAESEGVVMYIVKLESVKANDPLPNTLFVPERLSGSD